MKKIIVLLLLSICTGIDLEKNDKLYIKRIQADSFIIDWYTSSAAYLDNPLDILTIQREGKIDTICRTDNLIDFNYTRDTLFLYFYNSPMQYNRKIQIESNIYGKKIFVDTTRVDIKNYKKRKYFQIDNE